MQEIIKRSPEKDLTTFLIMFSGPAFDGKDAMIKAAEHLRANNTPCVVVFDTWWTVLANGRNWMNCLKIKQSEDEVKRIKSGKNRRMKTAVLGILAVGLLLIAGCRTAPQAEKAAVRIYPTEDAPAAVEMEEIVKTTKPRFSTTRQFHIDPNDTRTCRQWLARRGGQAANPPDYSEHPLYGEIDISLLKKTIEQTTGRHWIITFAQFWCDCHPFGDPIAALDVDWDGITDMRDFEMLSARGI